MKENSIKEDIILLKDFTEGNFKRDKLENYKGSYKMGYFYYKDIQQAIGHILSDYKRVLKENEELKNNTRKNENELEFDIDCDWIALQKMLDESEKSNEYISYKNEKWIKEKYCVPIQKIKDKIEKLEAQYKIALEENSTKAFILKCQITILQNLLGESEK